MEGTVSVKITGIWYFCEKLFNIISDFSNFNSKRKLFFFSSRKHVVYRVPQKVFKLLSLTYSKVSCTNNGINHWEDRLRC